MFFLNLIIGSISGFIAILPLLILFHIASHKQKDMNITKPHIIATYIFCFFLVAILSMTGIPSITDLKVDINVNLIPFADLFSNFTQYVLNVLLFIPLGFLLPTLWKKFEKKRLTFVTGFLFSLAIEITQIFTFRATDIDDLLMNTAGTIAGYYLFVLIRKLFPEITIFSDDGKAILRQREVWIYFALAWLTTFFVQSFISGWLWSFIL